MSEAEDMSICNSDSESAVTALDIDELYVKVAALEIALEEEKVKNAEEIEGLHERADIGITERAQCIQDIALLRQEITSDKLSTIDWIDGQAASTKTQTGLIRGIIIIAGAHCAWYLGTIAKKVIQSRT